MSIFASLQRRADAADQPWLASRSGGWRWPGGLAALALAGLAGCSQPVDAPEPVRAVKLFTVGAQTGAAQQRYAGEVRARLESRLGFRVAGKLVQRPVELGQPVRAGQLLAELDGRDYELAAQAARAQVTAASTQRDLAAAELERFARLRAQNFISSAEMDRREAALKSAQAQLAQAQAQAMAQGNQTGYTRLLADAAGVVTGIDAEPGQVVAAGTPVVRIARDGPRDAVFYLPEDRVAALRVGQPVQVLAWAGGQPLAAQVREVAASADPVTRTFLVKVGLEGQANLPLGATVQVLLSAPGTDALVGSPASAPLRLPSSALRQEGGGSAVWLFDPASSSLRSQPVQVAGLAGSEVLIGQGLQPGMQVVAAGVHVLSAGQKVTVYESKSAKASAGQWGAAMNNVATGAPASPASGASH